MRFRESVTVGQLPFLVCLAEMFSCYLGLSADAIKTAPLLDAVHCLLGAFALIQRLSRLFVAIIDDAFCVLTFCLPPQHPPTPLFAKGTLSPLRAHLARSSE